MSLAEVPLVGVASTVASRLTVAAVCSAYVRDACCMQRPWKRKVCWIFPSSVTSEICHSLVVGGTGVPVRTDVSPPEGGVRRLPLITHTQTLFFLRPNFLLPPLNVKLLLELRDTKFCRVSGEKVAKGCKALTYKRLSLLFSCMAWSKSASRSVT